MSYTLVRIPMADPREVGKEIRAMHRAARRTLKSSYRLTWLHIIDHIDAPSS